MARKVLVKLEVAVWMNLEEGETVDNAVQEMDYNFSYCPDDAENRVTDTEIRDYEVIETK